MTDDPRQPIRTVYYSGRVYAEKLNPSWQSFCGTRPQAQRWVSDRLAELADPAAVGHVLEHEERTIVLMQWVPGAAATLFSAATAGRVLVTRDPSSLQTAEPGKDSNA